MRRVLLAIAVAVGAGCPVTADPLCEKNVCAPTDGGVDAAPIDPCVDKPTAPECLDDAAAIFVSVNGDDQGEGTRARPYRSVAFALERVDAKRKRIYVCEGRYAQALLFSGKHDGASLIGGVDCAWTASNGRPVIGATANAVVINNASGLALASVVIEAEDNPMGSSIALRAVSANITLKKVRLVAGTGGAGADGTLTPHSYVAAATLDGKAGSGTTGGAATTFMSCEGQIGTATVGGKGGNSGMAGDPGQPDHPGSGGDAGAVIACAAGGDGVTGENGADGSNGQGASSVGDFENGIWMPAAGGNGTNGRLAQGGGGGAGIAGFGGGGGGAGGCGGAAGSGGRGGGGSIALASVFSVVSAEACSFVARAGGLGGRGAAGQPGQAGGAVGGGAGGACNGGGGGRGGNGGGGGGGAGGVSIGVLYKGQQPELKVPEITRAAGGGGGAGPSGNDGVAGTAADVHPLP
jgi:hypothetical protein